MPWVPENPLLLPFAGGLFGTCSLCYAPDDSCIQGENQCIRPVMNQLLYWRCPWLSSAIQQSKAPDGQVHTKRVAETTNGFTNNIKIQGCNPCCNESLLTSG